MTFSGIVFAYISIVNSLWRNAESPPNLMDRLDGSSERIRELSADIFIIDKARFVFWMQEVISIRLRIKVVNVRVLFARHQLHAVVHRFVKPSNMRQWTNRHWLQQQECVRVAIWKFVQKSNVVFVNTMSFNLLFYVSTIRSEFIEKRKKEDTYRRKVPWFGSDWMKIGFWSFFRFHIHFSF